MGRGGEGVLVIGVGEGTGRGEGTGVEEGMGTEDGEGMVTKAVEEDMGIGDGEDMVIKVVEEGMGREVEGVMVKIGAGGLVSAGEEGMGEALKRGEEVLPTGRDPATGSARAAATTVFTGGRSVIGARNPGRCRGRRRRVEGTGGEVATGRNLLLASAVTLWVATTGAGADPRLRQLVN